MSYDVNKFVQFTIEEIECIVHILHSFSFFKNYVSGEMKSQHT